MNHGDIWCQQLDLRLADRQVRLAEDTLQPGRVGLPDGVPVVPAQTADVHELRVLVEQRGERIGIAVVPRPREQDRDVCRRGGGGGGKLRVRPSAVEPHVLGPVLVQDVGGDDPQGSLSRQHHDHVSTGTDICNVMGQVFELFELEGTNQRPMKLREESMRGACRVEAVGILLTVQDVDVLLVESGPQQRVDGRLGLARVADGPDDAIRRVGDEVPCSVPAAFMVRDPVQRFDESIEEVSSYAA